jgi:hypothetical protein
MSTIIALIRTDRIAALYVTDTPASYVELPRWAKAYEDTRELPDTPETWNALNDAYQVELVSRHTDEAGQLCIRYRLTPHPIGADGHPVRVEV